MAPSKEGRMLAVSLFRFTVICVLMLIFRDCVVQARSLHTWWTVDGADLGATKSAFNWGLAPKVTNQRKDANPKTFDVAKTDRYNLPTLRAGGKDGSAACTALLFVVLVLLSFDVAVRINQWLNDNQFLLNRERDLEQQAPELEEVGLANVGNRQEMVKQLQSQADDMFKHYRSTLGARIFGAQGRVIGSSLAIVGFTVSYYTFGDSFGLVAVGTIVGAFGITGLIFSELTKYESKKRLLRQFAVLEEAALEYVRNRRVTIALLKKLADDLTTRHNTAEKAKRSDGNPKTFPSLHSLSVKAGSEEGASSYTALLFILLVFTLVDVRFDEWLNSMLFFLRRAIGFELMMLDYVYEGLEKKGVAYVRSRKETVKLLQSLADELTEHHRNTNRAKIAGGVAGIVGSGLAIAGYPAPGSLIDKVGGLTVNGATMEEMISSKLTSEKAKEILERDYDACKELIEVVHRVDQWYTELQNAAQVSRDEVATSVIEDLATNAVKKAVENTAINDSVFSVVDISFGLQTIISSAKYLHNKTIPEVSQVIHNIIENIDCPSEEEVIEFITEMKLRRLLFRASKRCVCPDANIKSPLRFDKLTILTYLNENDEPP